jgi:maleylacetate reductase
VKPSSTAGLMSYFQPEFSVKTAAIRVSFGAGARQNLPDEIRALGCSRAVVLTTPQQSDTALAFAEAIGDLSAGVFTRAAMHTPVNITEEAVRHITENRADCLVAIGGGSTTGLGKAIAYRTDLPQIVVPTTYAGSEATPILGQTEGGRKTTLSDERVQPEVIIYDAELVRTLPVSMTVNSGLNAMAHAAEALYARERNPISTALAVEGLQAFNDALPRVIADPDDLEARGETLYGAWLCGTVLGQVGMALHHKLCHTLGGSFGLPHAETHAIVLPHAIAFNARAVPGLLQPVCDIFGADNAGLALHGFAAAATAPMALKDLGLNEDDLDKAADQATENPYWNPQPVTRDGIRALLQAAWAGEKPVL